MIFEHAAATLQTINVSYNRFSSTVNLQPIEERDTPLNAFGTVKRKLRRVKGPLSAGLNAAFSFLRF